MSKIPQITLAFWIIKILATTLGETGGDFLSMQLNWGYSQSTIFLMVIFVASLVAQLRSKGYHPFLYWLVILSTSTVGTTTSDMMSRQFHLGYPQTGLILVSILVAVLGYWKVTEKSIDVTQAMSLKVEILYWTAILASNTLGTAFGDYLSDSLELGYLQGALSVGTAILITFLLYKFTPISKVALFWLAFVLTRPLGATVGDLLTKAHDKGGMDLSKGGASLVLVVVLVVIIAMTQPRKRAAEALA